MEKDLRIYIPKDFTVESVADFRFKIKEYIGEGKINFVFDFSNCDFIDSTGLGAIVSIYKKCVEKQGTLRLEHLKPEVNELFKLTRLDRVFDIE
ncbi:MAG: STAS domain-containing protein [Clostridium butyricum]|nr:STAS domain-containing protein [Clostridium butyricum]